MPPNPNPRIRRVASIVLLGLAIGGLSWLIAGSFGSLNKSLTLVVLSALGERADETLRTIVSQPTIVPNPLRLLPLMIVSVASVWASYKLQGFGRIVTFIQISFIGLFLEWLQWKFTQGFASPLANLTSVLLGCSCGYWLKRQDDFRRTLQSQHYELRLRNQELQSSRLLLVKQDEVERRLLAADLHDQVLNDLKAVVDKFNRYETEKDGNLADEINRDLQKSIGAVREIMDNLCPLILEHFGLPAAIEQCLENGAKRAGFDYRLVNRTSDEDLEKLSAVQQQLLFRLAQESITNVCKHAQANIVKVFIETKEQRLVLRVVDDGKGMPSASDLLDTSRGVQYMRLRAGLIGAKLEWLPTEPRGATVEISLPLVVEAQPAEH